MEITTTISEFLWHIFWVLSIALTMLVLCLVTQSCLTLPIPWAAAHQVPLSIGILHIRIPEWVAMPSSHGGSHALDLPNPGVKPRSPSLQVDSLPNVPPGKPKNTGVVTYRFSRGSSQSRDQTQVSLTAGGFFTAWATREAHKSSQKPSEVNCIIISCVSSLTATRSLLESW